MVEKKIFAQQFMNTQRNEAPDFDQVSLLQQIQKKQDAEHRERLRPAVDEAIAEYRRVGSIIKTE